MGEYCTDIHIWVFKVFIISQFLTSQYTIQTNHILFQMLNWPFPSSPSSPSPRHNYTWYLFCFDIWSCHLYFDFRKFWLFSKEFNWRCGVSLLLFCHLFQTSQYHYWYTMVYGSYAYFKVHKHHDNLLIWY